MKSFILTESLGETLLDSFVEYIKKLSNSDDEAKQLYAKLKELDAKIIEDGGPGNFGFDTGPEDIRDEIKAQINRMNSERDSWFTLALKIGGGLTAAKLIKLLFDRWKSGGTVTTPEPSRPTNVPPQNRPNPNPNQPQNKPTYNPNNPNNHRR